jgi:tetratricopeptide (TPR) repeat protein
VAGNRALYEQAMNDGHTAAWDQEWVKAIQSYARAVQEFPEDPAAHNSLGLALLNNKRYEDALKVYNRAHILSPDDAIPLEKSADVLERLGRLQEAASKYVAVADVYLAQRDLDKAIGNWERATRLTPGLLQIHFRLAQAYERVGQKRSALREYLTLAFNFQRNSDKAKAIQAVDRALRLEPTNAQAINAKAAIEADAFMAVPQGLEEEKRQIRNDDDILFPSDTAQGRASATESNPNGPLGEAAEKALVALAEVVMSGDLSMATAQVIQAIELQKTGQFSQAAVAYQRAETSGMRYPALLICLGYAFLQLENWADAEKYLLRIPDEPDFSAGAAHGLGVAYMGLGQQRRAAEELINSLKLVDIGLAMNTDESSQLEAVYNALLKTVQKMQDGDLQATNEQFLKWLTGSDWKVRIAETRRSLSERLSSEGDKGLFDYVRDNETVDMVRVIDRYIKQGLLTLAMDEAFRVIEKEPTFLPVHQRVAQILMEEGHIQAAITKYNIIADSFLARDDTSRAAEILNEVIAIAPMDINLRMSLIELLEKEQQWDKLLDEYISLANAHYQLADFEQSRATYQEAQRLAQKVNAPANKRAEILRKLADIDMSRLDLRGALRNYEQVRTLEPEDEATRKTMIDIHYRLNNPIEAVKELDGLLRAYAQQRRGDLIIGTLEQMVVSTPNDMAIRSRLAAVYRQTNRRMEAIAQLDALGELQLEAGLYQDACATIKQIMTLQPNDMEQYRNLLSQLGC